MKRKMSESSSSDDEVPINLLLNKHHKLSSAMKTLLMYKQEKCDICAKLFFNTYDLMVHNAKHIIIPLTRETLQQCKKCHKYFATAIDLKVHEEVEHFEVPDVLIDFCKSEPVVKCENTVTNMIIQHNEIKLEQIFKKEAIVKCDSIVTDFIYEKSNEMLGPFVSKEPIISCDDTITRLLKADDDDDDDVVFIPDGAYGFEGKVDLGLSESNGQIKSKIIFEDDFDDDFDMADRKNPAIEKHSPAKFVGNKILIGSKITNQEHDDDETYSPSVHYDELVYQELHKCDLCPVIMHNRYDLILHKTKYHLNIDTKPNGRSYQVCRYCEQYIIGNYRHMVVHLRKQHGKEYKPYQNKKCQICRWKYYNIFKHLNKCQCVPYQDYLNKNKKVDDAKASVFEHKKVWINSDDKIQNPNYSPDDEKTKALQDKSQNIYGNGDKSVTIINVCSICARVLRTTPHTKYLYMGNNNAPPRLMGNDSKKRLLKCSLCQNRFEEVKVYKRVVKKALVKTCLNKPKFQSKEQRLENIRKRLKMLK